jgi:hypothetical protein
MANAINSMADEMSVSYQVRSSRVSSSRRGALQAAFRKPRNASRHAGCTRRVAESLRAIECTHRLESRSRYG